MGDFRLKVKADLDAKDLESKLAKLKKDKVPIPVELDIKNLDINKLVQSLSNINKKAKVNIDTSGVDSGVSKIQKMSAEMQKIKNFQIKIETKGIDSDIAKIESKFKKIQRDSLNSTQKNQYDSVAKAIQELNSAGSKLDKNNLNTASIDKYNSKLLETKNLISILTSSLSEMSSATERITFTSQMESWLKNNTKATKEARNEVQSYIDDVKSLGSSMSKMDLNNLKNNFKEISTEMIKQGNTGRSFREDFSRAFNQITQFAGIYSAIQNIIFEVPRQMASVIREVNASQIELTKVTTASPTQLTQYWDQAAESAKKYGAAISDVINSTADWSRLGYSLDEAKELSDATTLLQKVGDNMTQESSSEGMISVLKGFQMQADQAESIVDKVNQVANTQPIDTSGLFEGLERSASSMDAANNSLEQTIALITAANSVVQDPDSVGM